MRSLLNANQFSHKKVERRGRIKAIKRLRAKCWEVFQLFFYNSEMSEYPSVTLKIILAVSVAY